MKYFVAARTQPPHKGHISMLEAACLEAEEVIIGIGSSNVVDERNPYSAKEREMMLDKSLQDIGLSNYRFVHIPDFNDDNEWIAYVENKTGIDYQTTILSGNPWVESVFENKGYQTLRPQDIITKQLYDISATEIRNKILVGDQSWKDFAASGTLHYFEEFGGASKVRCFYQKAA